MYWIGVRCTTKKLLILSICHVRDIRTHTTPLFLKLNLLKLEDIYKLQISKIMHKINNNSWFGNFNLIRTENIHQYNTRSNSCNYFVSSNNLSPKSIYKVGPRVWRKIPKELKLLNFSLFKKYLIKHLLSFYNLL